MAHRYFHNCVKVKNDCLVIVLLNKINHVEIKKDICSEVAKSFFLINNNNDDVIIIIIITMPKWSHP